jgi:signal transduction histidine kinase/ActR/RegA family two-component response regulator
MRKFFNHFSIFSLIAVLVTALAISAVHWRVTRQAYAVLGEGASIAVATSLAHVVWGQFGPLLRDAANSPAERLRVHPMVGEIDRLVRAHVAETKLVKIKIYAPNGVTLYSSEHAQIGQNKNDNAGFRSALAGTIASELGFRAKFSAFEQEINDRDLLSTYVPIRQGRDGSVSLVFETYLDVTEELARLRHTELLLGLGLFAVLLTLYTLQLTIIRLGTREVDAAHDALAQQARELRTAKLDLEGRVTQRTAELTSANEALMRQARERELGEIQARAASERLSRQQQALADLFRGEVLRGDGADVPFRVITELASRVLEVSRVSVWMLARDGSYIECGDLFESTANRHSSGARLAASEFPAYFAALRDDELIVAHHAQTDSKTKEFCEGYLRPLGITSMLDAPILLEGDVVGVICCEHVGEPIQWRPDQQIFAVALSSISALVLRERELARTLKALTEANLAAEAASRAKSRFVANMSHEIRTPMNGILGVAELMQVNARNDEQRRAAAISRRCTDDLLRLVSDVLDFSKIEAGRVEFEAIEFSPAQAVVETIELFQSKAESIGIRLEKAIDANVPARLQGDPLRLRQILSNLLGNAVKFTREGSVRISVCAADFEATDPLDRDRACRIVFEVADTGIGIAPADLPRVFDAFSQADESTTRRFGGTGLGLAIVRQLVHLMGGEVSAQSEPGHGSTFRVVLPFGVRQCALAGDTPEVIAANDPDSKRVLSGRVLLVEDNEINRLIAAEMLAVLGVNPKIAVDGREAVAAARSERFDLILMDCHMPEMDGFEATREIRAYDQAHGEPRVAIVALTANAMQGDREVCLASGMDDYLAKPLTLDALRVTLARWIAGPVTDSLPRAA